MQELALKNIRVADFSWALAGPYAMKMLADQGAEVIKIESARTMHQFAYAADREEVDIREVDRGPMHDLLNRNKLSMMLDLKTEKGLEIVKRLVKESDIVAENFSGTAMKNLGLDYPVLREINPSIIMISLAGMGHFGPYASYRSHGNTLEAMCGIDEITGYADSGPMDPGMTYLDYGGGVHGAIAVLAALRHRLRTGEGQYIDLGQLDLGCSLAGLSILDYTANGRIQRRAGNKHPWASPHGTYRCKGEDRWCTLVVFNDEEWRNACQVMGNPFWASDARFATTLGRASNSVELDKLVGTWTIERSPEEVMQLMQQNGVESGVVETMEDLITKDKHLKERGLYQEVPQRTRSVTIMEGIPYKMSKTPGEIAKAGPFPGEHTGYVCREVLGMSDEEFEECERQGVFS